MSVRVIGVSLGSDSGMAEAIATADAEGIKAGQAVE
jgi:hypothetical protein